MVIPSDFTLKVKYPIFEKFGKDGFTSFDVEKWLEIYEPVHLEITKEQYEYARDLD